MRRFDITVETNKGAVVPGRETALGVTLWVGPMGVCPITTSSGMSFLAKCIAYQATQAGKKELCTTAMDMRIISVPLFEDEIFASCPVTTR